MRQIQNWKFNKAEEMCSKLMKSLGPEIHFFHLNLIIDRQILHHESLAREPHLEKGEHLDKIPTGRCMYASVKNPQYVFICKMPIINMDGVLHRQRDDNLQGPVPL